MTYSSEIKEQPRWRRVLGWPYLPLAGLVLATLILHAIILMSPPEPLFDEQHYVPDARSILEGNGTQRSEHPPLGKLGIALGILLFGDNPLGWRFFSILLGTVSIVLFYLICRRLNLSHKVSGLATFLLAFENLTFLQASVAMLDVYTVTFMLAAFWLYLKERYLLAGVAIGLAALAKLPGSFALGAIFLHWLITSRRREFWALALTSLLSFMLLMPVLDFATSRELLDPVTRIRTMLTASGSLTFAGSGCTNCSRPWEWVLLPEILFYWYTPPYIGAISFTVWALIIPAFGYLIYETVRRNWAALFGLGWFASTYLVWLPLSLITDRISFLFYFYPTVGAVCLALGMGFGRLLDWGKERSARWRWSSRAIVWTYVILHLGVFMVLSPVFSTWIKLIPIPV